jgi:hypothetical protein
MTTILPDVSLDIGRRLANLRTWQAEWQRIDRELEEQLIQLGGNTLTSITARRPHRQCATTHGHDPGERAPLHS